MSFIKSKVIRVSQNVGQTSQNPRFLSLFLEKEKTGLQEPLISDLLVLISEENRVIHGDCKNFQVFESHFVKMPVIIKALFALR